MTCLVCKLPPELSAAKPLENEQNASIYLILKATALTFKAFLSVKQDKTGVPSYSKLYLTAQNQNSEMKTWMITTLRWEMFPDLI